MRSPLLLASGTLALIAIVAIAGCGQLTATARQDALAMTQQTPLPAVHIDMVVDRFQFTKPEELCNQPLVAEVVLGAHGEAR
jgi:hypothetical protein